MEVLHTKVAQVAASAFNIPLSSVFISETSTDKVISDVLLKVLCLFSWQVIYSGPCSEESHVGITGGNMAWLYPVSKVLEKMNKMEVV